MALLLATTVVATVTVALALVLRFLPYPDETDPRTASLGDLGDNQTDLGRQHP